MKTGVSALSILRSKKSETSRYPKGWELYSAFRKIILEVKTDSFDWLSRAFVDLYRFRAKRDEFEERELIHKVLELEKSMDSYLDWKLYAAYVLYGYLWSKIRGDQSKLIDSIQRCKDKKYFLGVHEGGFQIINSILGLIYSLADSAISDAYINEVFGRLENKQSDLAELFQMNYYLGLFLFDDKWTLVSQTKKDACDNLANKIDLNETLSPKEKMVILPFIKDRGSKYFPILTEETVLSDYYLHLYSNSFYESPSDEESVWLQFSPIWIVKFLLIAENMGWDKLSLVPPSLFKKLEKFGKLENPVVLSKSQYYSKVVFFAGLAAYSTFVIMAFILKVSVVTEWINYLSAVIGVTLFFYFIMTRAQNRNREKEGD